jgi:hypothetical protein
MLTFRVVPGPQTPLTPKFVLESTNLVGEIGENSRGPVGAITRFGLASPAMRLRFDTPGTAAVALGQ